LIAALVLLAALQQAGTGLDCAKGPDALLAAVQATPNLKSYAGADPNLDQWYDSAGNLYAATRPGHAAHPTIIKRVINEGAAVTVDTSACSWTDGTAYDALMQDIQRLNAALIRSRGG
jgi:hypothetical protein